MTAMTIAESEAVARTATAVREVLSFRLGPQEYGIDIRALLTSPERGLIDEG